MSKHSGCHVARAWEAPCTVVGITVVTCRDGPSLSVFRLTPSNGDGTFNWWTRLVPWVIQAILGHHCWQGCGRMARRTLTLRVLVLPL